MTAKFQSEENSRQIRLRKRAERNEAKARIANMRREWGR